MRSVLLALALSASTPAAPVPPAAPVAPAPAKKAPTSAARKGDAARVAPPSLTANALASELRDASRRRTEELAALAAERQRLEALAGDIAAARKALQDESARLERQISAARDAQLEADRRRAQAPREEPPKPSDASDDLDGKQVDVLARTLKGMKRDAAAGMLEQLPRPLAAAVLQRLKPIDSAALLGKMKTGSAAELFTMLSRSDAGAKP
jgi:flagellar motility protein MotE (MotC chaperone)